METKHWNTSIDLVTDEVRQKFGELTADQLNWKPNEQTWSIAQNVDHLIKINESYYPIIQAVSQGTYQTPVTGKIRVLVSYIGKTLLKAVQPDRKRKMKTMRIWEPTKGTLGSDIVKQFESHQNELKKRIADSGDLIENGVVISSPANRFIVYKLETAFDVIVTHEQRHLNQAKEILQLLSHEKKS